VTGQEALASQRFSFNALDLKWFSSQKHHFDEFMKAAECDSNVMGRLVFSLVDARGELWTDFRSFDSAASGESMARPITISKEACIRVLGLRYESMPRTDA